MQPLEPFSWKVFQPRDRKTISSVAIHNLTYGRQNNLFLLCKPPTSLPHKPATPLTPTPLSLSAVAPKETDEYRREELGSWKHELRWHRRALADDPAWYFNRLVWICVLAWLVSLIPGTLDMIAASAVALVAVVRWAREILLALPEHASTRSF